MRVVKDREVIEIAGLAIQAHDTAGHTPGSTTWTWRSCATSAKATAAKEGTRCLNMVYADSLTAVSAPGFRFTGDAKTPSRVEKFRQSIATVAALPCDIVITTHPSATNLDGKLKRRAERPAVDPLIDPQGCRALAAAATKQLDARSRRRNRQEVGHPFQGCRGNLASRRFVQSAMVATRLAFALFLLATAALSPSASIAQSAQTTTALVGGRVYPNPEGVPIDDAVVVMAGGRISAAGPRAAVAVPPGATVIDAKGLVITAGFQNSHVHFTDMARWADAGTQPAGTLTAHLREMVTRYGFTTVVNTASVLANTKALRQRIDSGEVLGPRILTAGFAIYPPDGVPYYVRDEVPPELLRLLPTPASAASARALVKQQLDDGANLVKLFAGSVIARGKVLPMPADIAAAAAGEAHARKLQVLAHPSNLAGLEVALNAGVDVLAHAIEDTRGMTDAHYARMKSQNMAMIPTLYLFRDRWMWDVLDEVRTFARQGGQILFGTDVGYLPDFDHANEYDLMAAAGLGWREILASLTVSPAERFGEAAARGRVAAGFAADLVVLGSDPAHGVRNFADVRYTIRGGRVIYQAPSR